MDPKMPTQEAQSKSKRHWRVLRNALLSKTRDGDTDSTASSVSTQFFPQFPVHTLEVGNDGSHAPHHAAEASFVWVVYEIDSRAFFKANSFGQSVKRVRVHEKLKQQKVSVADLFSHKLNQGVDNTGNIRTWPSEQVLLAYLLKEKVTEQVAKARGARIHCCELGAGMAGLVSLGLLAHDDAGVIARFLVTDGNQQAVRNLQICVDENMAQHVVQREDTRIAVELMRWDRTAHFDSALRHQFDLIVVSDCLFFEEFHQDLAYTIRELLRPGTGRCLLLQPSRNGSLERFCAIAKELYGLGIDVSRNYDAHISALHATYETSRDDYVADVHFPVLLTVTAPIQALDA